MTRRNEQGTVRAEGGLFTRDFLERVRRGDDDLDGLRAPQYHLPKGERLADAISRSWARLVPAWKSFRTYLGVGASISAYAHRVSGMGIEPASVRGLAPGAELLAGFQRSGFFVELAGTYLRLQDSRVRTPALGAAAAVGYRLEIP